MKTLIINESGLSIDEVDEVVTRVKCFIANGEGKIILASTADGCMQLPGGHVEEDEDLLVAVKREVYEETGIILDEQDKIEMFYGYEKYKKNKCGSGKNKLGRIYYFYIQTNKPIDLINTNMTQHEQNAGFFVDFLSVAEIEKMLVKNSNEHEIPIYRTVAKETLVALQELKEMLKNK